MLLLNLWIPIHAPVQPLALMDQRTVDAVRHQLRFGLPVDGFLERDEDAAINDIWRFLYHEDQQWFVRIDMDSRQGYLFNTLGTAHGAACLSGEDTLAPLWLALVILMGTGLVTLESGLAFALILLTLLIPKLAGLWRLAGPGATTWRRQVACRALAAELMLSSLLAPIVMLHHTAAVVSVLCGRDCGWKRPGGNGPVLPQGLLEMATGLGLTALVVTLNPQGAAWIAPLVAPMIAAPLLIGRIDAVRPDCCPPQNPA